MLVNNGVLGGDQGVDVEEDRDVAVQLQYSSLQIHHQGPQGRKNVVHVCAHSEELSSDRGAGRAQAREGAGYLHVVGLHQTC